jgi:hypothetical protein
MSRRLTGVGNIGRSHNSSNLLHALQVWALDISNSTASKSTTHQTTVHGEDLLVNDSSDWQTVEAVGKGLPQLDVVTTFA